MGTSQGNEPDREERLVQVIAEYLRDLESGSAPSREDLLARHPDLADHLRSFFVALDQPTDRAQPTRIEHQPAVPDDAEDTLAARFADTNPLGDRFGDFELLEEIARGGMGVVTRPGS